MMELLKESVSLGEGACSAIHRAFDLMDPTPGPPTVRLEGGISTASRALIQYECATLSPTSNAKIFLVSRLLILVCLPFLLSSQIVFIKL